MAEASQPAINDSTLKERFWARVDRRGDDECWEWDRSRHPQGYGVFFINGDRAHGAHRIAYRMECGDIPAGMCVLHRCDNPPCVNPSHLWLGTRADNNADKSTKGRNRTGPRLTCPTASLLSEDRIRSIRILYESGRHTTHDLARVYGVSRRAIVAALPPGATD